MAHILINLPNEEFKHNGNVFIQPNLKKLVNILNDKQSILKSEVIDNAYISLALKPDIFYSNESYTITPDDIMFIIINPPVNDRSKDKNFHRVCLEVTIAGKYIPVYNMNGYLLFTEEQFNYIRNQMNGLSRYGMEEKFVLAPDEMLILPEFELNGKVYNMDKLVRDIQTYTPRTEYIRSQIIDSIESKLNEDLPLEEEIIIDEELHNEDNPKIIEMIDTGSTGRGTNIPGTGDFDFMFRISDPNYNGAVNYYKSKILDQFALKTYDSDTNDLRLKDIYIQGPDKTYKVDIDITFAEKSKEIDYPTEMCVQDRLRNIKSKYPDKYNYVLANIIVAKDIMKGFGAYKKRTSHENPQGGMGGIGVETWVLENNGSFTYACQTFFNCATSVAQAFNADINTLTSLAQANPDELLESIKADSNGEKVSSQYKLLIDVFKVFQAYYPVYDFGQNHIIGKANSKRKYPHDDFIYNMSAIGFYKMLDGIMKYNKALDDLNNVKNK